MRWTERLSELGRRLQMLFSRQERFDHDLEEEMRLHLDLRALAARKRGGCGKCKNR